MAEPIRYKLITLDVYSALFDYRGGLIPAVLRLLGPGCDAAELVAVWRRKQMEYAQLSNALGQGRVPFRLVTRRALDYALAQAEIEPREPLREALAAAWDSLPLWPEAAEVLQALHARGAVLALLSNGDEAMLRALAARLPVPMAHIFASEQAGYYKPHPAVYRLPLEALGLPPAAVLHVAGGAVDVMGAKAAGLGCAWSNRTGDLVLDPALRADFEFPDLRGLLGAA